MDIFIQATPDNKKTLFLLLEEKNLFISSICMKKGICGSCTIQVIKGNTEPSPADLKYFSDTRIRQGFRLACTSVPKQDILVRISSSCINPAAIQSTMEVFMHGIKKGQLKNTPLRNPASIFLLIDIGTTTVAFLLSDENGIVMDSLLIPNPQIPYGTDVISRLHYANQGNLPFLSKLIRDQLKSSAKQLLERNRLSVRSVSHCYIAGNTSMIHLLMEYPCSHLGVAPFTPYNKDVINITDFAVPVTIFSCVSGFIGGDLIAGIYSLDFNKRMDTVLLIDCGTNGEIALLHAGKCYATSTAAGPAMEGGNLSCGGASVSGAITGVTLGGISPRVRTIGNKLPVHLCGTGAISCISELIKHQYIDSMGLPTEKFSEESILLAKKTDERSISFNMEDVRQMQLALSSIRAGYETLFSVCGIMPSQIDHVYLAGGFGCEINLRDAFRCHLFPSDWEGRIQTVGNSCLAGLQKYSLNNHTEFLEQITSEDSFLQTIQLAHNDTYQSLFLKYLSFQ